MERMGQQERIISREMETTKEKSDPGIGYVKQISDIGNTLVFKGKINTKEESISEIENRLVQLIWSEAHEEQKD